MQLDEAFWGALWDLAQQTGTRPEIFLAVWYVESGLNPHARNSIGCIGLNQSCPKPGGPGFPNDDADTYQSSPASAQIAWIAPQVRRAISLNGAPFRSAARYYQSNFLPGTLRTATGPRDIIASSNAPLAWSRRAYAANKVLDANNDGAITLEDLGHVIQKAVDQSVDLRDAIAATYEHQPADALWTTPDLVVYEGGNVPTIAPPRGGGGALVGVALLVGVAFFRRHA